jgi:hypothetical protein
MAAISTHELLFNLLRYNVLQTPMVETEKTMVYTEDSCRYIPNSSGTSSVPIYLEVMREKADLQSSKCDILHIETN